VALRDAIGQALAAQRGRLLCWAPVFLAIGIGGYLSLTWEPEWRHWLLLGAAMLPVALFVRRGPEDWRPLAGAVLLVAAGAALAGARTHLVAAPVLGFRYYGPLEGRIVMIDRSASDAVRLTLDRVVLRRVAPERTPLRVRVSLHGRQGFITPEPGLTVIMTAHLAPPPGPVEPGGFDFRRLAWFDRLGAVGYTRAPVLALAPPEPRGVGMRIYRARMALSAWVRERMPGDAGAFAAAVMTGDRSAIGRTTMENLRASNLAHLLAISGLHMGLLTGFVFALARQALVMLPGLALRCPAKKVAALLALAAGAGYLALSGGNVATQRAFVMVSVVFVAVLLERRAITLRAVAVAALIVLALRPESLTEAGFQMSFAATVALVAVFGALREWRGWRVPRRLRPVLAVVLSSAVAGAATAPVAAAHFNRIADYGLLANLASVPLMGLLVIPGAVLAALLAPFGLGEIGLAVMRPAIAWILGVAEWVAGLEGALTHVPSPGAAPLPMLALGMLWALLWRGSRIQRAPGVAVALGGLLLWAQVERPEVLVSETGGLIGVLGPQGRALSKPRGESFAARSWLENDGDGADQKTASARPGLREADGIRLFRVGGRSLAHLSGRGAAGRVAEACRRAEIVFMSSEPDRAAPAGCELYPPSRLRRTGALALRAAPGGAVIRSARAHSRQRPWTGALPERPGPERPGG